MSIISLISGNDTPVGEQWVDDRIEEGQELISSAVNQVKAWSMDDPDTWTDDALRWIGGAIKSTGNWWQDATADQEGIGDDALRLLGGGVKNAMRVLDAGSYYGGKIGGGIAEFIGVDARIGGFTGNILGDVFAGGVAAKAMKTYKMGNQLQRLRKLNAPPMQLDDITKGYHTFAWMDDTKDISRLEDYFTALKAKTKSKARLNTLENQLTTLRDYRHPLFRDILEKKTTKLGKKVKATDFNTNRQFNRVEHMDMDTLKTLYDKAGSDPEMFDDFRQKLNQAYEYYEVHGELKGLPGGTKWYNPKTGEGWLIKGKMASHERITLGADSLKSVEATKELRKKSAEITKADVLKAYKDIPGMTKDQALSYYKKQKTEFSILTKLIRDLNHAEGKRTWSLGHGRAVKALRDAGSGHADMFTNIELERLKNLLDDKGNILARGNSSRAASDELHDVVNTVLNRSRNLKEDMIKYADSDLSKFFPQMEKYTDEASFLKAVGKRDAFVDAVERFKAKIDELHPNLTEKQKWTMATNVVLDKSGTMTQSTKQVTRFLDTNKYKNLKPDPDMFL